MYPYSKLETIIKSVFQPSDAQLDAFKSALLESPIAHLFFRKAQPKKKLNAYMIYLLEKRAEIKECLLEETPDLNGRAMANKIIEIAGAAWRASTQEEKNPYFIRARALE
jgi:hypothetical protein